MKAQPTEVRLSLRLPDEEATARLAEDIAAVLRAGDLVALSGSLGSGKTMLARAMLRSISGDPALEAPSPTFPLRIDYSLPRLKVVHADLYRLGSEAELEELGLDEAVGEAALLVEWPERLPPHLSAERLDVALEIDGEGRRAVLIGHGSWPQRLARTARVRAFLDRSGWARAARSPLAGDASSRTYERIALAAGTAILMNAPARPEGPAIYDGRSYDAVAHRALDVRPFIAIDLALRNAGIHAPLILAADVPSGLLLLEDLGGAGLVDEQGRPFLERYEAAIDVLVAMHRQQWPAAIPMAEGESYAIPPYDRAALLVEISLFPDYFRMNDGTPAIPAARREEFLAAWSAILDRLDPLPPTLVLRDFHSPNILWRESETGVGRVGVIDFQDALIGHPAYDVASLAQDARVPLTGEDEARLTARYVAARSAEDKGFDAAAFDAAYAVLGLQRATKVLGGFARLAQTEGKPGYQRHRERLKELVRRNLSHPVLSPMRVWYEPLL